MSSAAEHCWCLYRSNLDNLVKGRVQVSKLDFTDSFAKALLLSPIFATLSSNSLHITESKLHSKEKGKRITCFPELRLFILPQTWYLNERQSFLFQNVHIKYSFKISLWWKMIRLPNVDNEIIESTFLLEKQGNPWSNCRVFFKTSAIFFSCIHICLYKCVLWVWGMTSLNNVSRQP